MTLQEFFNKENININVDEYILESFDDTTLEKYSFPLSDYSDWFIDKCYDKDLNEKKCLCLKFHDYMEYMWRSCLELRKELSERGYELFILDNYLIYGSLEEYDMLSKDEIQEYVKDIKEDWFMFYQYQDKLILVIDDETNYETGYWTYRDHLTCYMYNVNYEACQKRTKISHKI